MNRGKKWFLVLVIVLLLPPPIWFLASSSNVWQKYLNLNLPQLGKANPVFNWYLIGISAIVIVLLVVSLFIVLFWPTRKKFKLLRRKGGRVKVTSNAINGFIESSLADVPYINNVKVASKLTNRRIKIKITGNLGTGENLTRLLDEYLSQVIQDLRTVLGIEQKPKISITFKNFQSSKKSSQRVS